MQRRSDYEYVAWRKRALRAMPNLAERVFALRDFHYLGCGLHYALEMELGQCIAKVADPFNDLVWKFKENDEGFFRERIGERIVAKATASWLFEQVAMIEREIGKRNCQLWRQAHEDRH